MKNVQVALLRQVINNFHYIEDDHCSESSRPQPSSSTIWRFVNFFERYAIIKSNISRDAVLIYATA